MLRSENLIDGVTQTTTGWPFGSCVRASYATILGLPLEAIPPLDPGAAMLAGEDQGERERAWLESIGIGLVELGVDPPAELPDSFLRCVPDVPHLMSGISPRGFGHRVVGIGGRIAFDPHPSRAGLVTVYSVGFLVPLEAM